MTDLFRYIEQHFVIPTADAVGINTSDDSDFQEKLRNSLQAKNNSQQLLDLAEEFIAGHTGEGLPDIRMGAAYLKLYNAVKKLATISTDHLTQLIEKNFANSAAQLLQSTDFNHDRQLLNDLIIAVKISTGFDKLPGAELVAMRQCIALIENFAGNNDIPELIQQTLLLPVMVPDIFLVKPAAPPPPPVTRNDNDEAEKRVAAQKEYDSLRAAYSTLMSVKHYQLQLVDTAPAVKIEATNIKNAKFKTVATELQIPERTQALTINSAVTAKLDPVAMKFFQNEGLNIRSAPYPDLVRGITSKIDQLGKFINPCTKIKSVSRVYRLGVNAFVVTPDPVPAPASATLPGFSAAITRPVGIGNLQVVRQELIGYEAKEISHIENVLEGEVLRHTTIRTDTTEVTTTQGTTTTQSEERDLQSTTRNEMVAETQKEAGQESSTTQGQNTSSSYGKLVENSKSNFAKTVTDKAVTNLSQQVSNLRVEREKKKFTEKTVHQFDNSKVGAKNITGIYQWVDKKYKTRIMNYGSRLLYDVVVPEPAAFLIDSLKNAPQPEGLELIKPDVFDLCPDCLDKFNYACLAAKYGVAGSVTAPPDDFLYTVQQGDTGTGGPPKVDNAGDYFKNFSIHIKDDYKAIECYVKVVAPNDIADGDLAFAIGEYGRIHFNLKNNYFQKKIVMREETGDIPVTFRTYNIYQFSYAIGINCQRTEQAFENWQLKTHAAIMNGYNRQLSEYQDKLTKFQAIVRAQMANASNYNHNPSIEQGELKKAFIYLLLGEHFGGAYVPTPDPLQYPPVPLTIKNWGAMVAFFERAFEWENMMYTYYPYFWGRRAKWGELILIQDLSPQFEDFLKAGAARVVIPVRPGFEGALAHYHETGKIWMGEDMPDIFSPLYTSIIQEIKARNFAPGEEKCVAEWDVSLPTTLVKLKDDASLPSFPSTVKCTPDL